MTRRMMGVVVGIMLAAGVGLYLHIGTLTAKNAELAERLAWASARATALSAGLAAMDQAMALREEAAHDIATKLDKDKKVVAALVADAPAVRAWADCPVPADVLRVLQAGTGYGDGSTVAAHGADAPDAGADDDR